MNERAKITASHLARQAIVYLRQSSPAQVEHNRESTQRQYALANRARELGWSDEQIVVIDEDLGLSGAGSVARMARGDLGTLIHDRSPLTATSAIMRAIMRANSSSAAMRAA